MEVPEERRPKAAKLDEKENAAATSTKKVRGVKRKGKVGEREETEAMREKKAPVAKFKIPANILKVIASDKIKKRLWGDVQSKEFNTRKELVDSVEEMFQFQFCMSLVTQPVTTPCSLPSASVVCSEYYTCSVCRADLQDTKLEVN